MAVRNSRQAGKEEDPGGAIRYEATWESGFQIDESFVVQIKSFRDGGLEPWKAIRRIRCARESASQRHRFHRLPLPL